LLDRGFARDGKRYLSQFFRQRMNMHFLFGCKGGNEECNG